VLTDVHGDGGLTISMGASCASGAPREGVASGGEQHGMRVFVPAGSSLCNDYNGTRSFSGFRPY
jgi:hypothetical protein